MIATRRTFLLSTAAIFATAAFPLAGAWAEIGKPGKVAIRKFSDAGEDLGLETVDKVVKSDAEWRVLLANAPATSRGKGPPNAYTVTRQEDTEWAGTGPNWDNHSAGLYRCICCDNALYTNETKYDSHTGWPSFWQPIAAENVLTGEAQNGGHKVWCALCDAHLGHVFDDGPKPTGLRYCMDGVAMRFVAWPTT